ncbi:spermatogenesis-associated protein 16-like [Chanos chanos]|uniref:Spermatogenesis-associated protein 16-like n=1 Tax=Chanos chanos TaxID=29144 RepID=A0A6J2WN55_CHACN|nr:spermatogenesis-associated protein 16 [Chanos chanos]
MDNSAGVSVLLGPKAMPEPSANPAREDLNNNPLSSFGEQCQNRRKRKRTDRVRASRKKRNAARKRDGWSPDEIAGAGNEESSLRPLPRIPLKSMKEAEANLAFGDEQDITHKAPASAAATQLKCQSCEIVGLPSGPNLGFLPQIDKWLNVALQDGSSHYRQKKYAVAVSRFTTALELCSKGSVLEEPCDADYEDVAKVVSFIESRLVACYLRMKRPDLALLHSHRSIRSDPIYFRNHLRQAMVYRLLGNPCEAVRSAMIADYVYWLSGGVEEHISKLIKLYWQGLLEEAITMEENFSVLYTPCVGKVTKDFVEQTEETFRNLHPAFSAYIFTDPLTGHLLPQTTDWRTDTSTQSYTLTIGFKRSQDGQFLDKLLLRRCPTFTGLRSPFIHPTSADAGKMCEALGRKILPVLDFIKCTKLDVGFSAGSGLIERLQFADYLGQLSRTKEQSQILEHTLAELGLAPYLQDISPTDASLLQELMAESVDTLEGKRTDHERVWNALQKVGDIEEMLYEMENVYLKNKALRAVRRQQARERRREAKRRWDKSMPKKVPAPVLGEPASWT